MTKRSFVSYLLVTLLLCGVTFVNESCKRADDPPLPPEKPELKVIPNFTYPEPGDEVVFEVEAYSRLSLDSFRVELAKGNTPLTVVYDTIFPDNSELLDFDYLYPIEESATLGRKDSLIFTAVDAEGNRAQVVEYVRVVDHWEEVKPNTGSYFTIYSKLATGQESAYSLVDMSPRAVNDPDEEKDLMEISSAQGQFAHTFGAGDGNGSLFVLAPEEFDYETTNEYVVRETYDAGEKKATVVVEKNDVVIVNIGGTDEFAVLQIVDVIDDSGTNSDRIQFVVKKKD